MNKNEHGYGPLIATALLVVTCSLGLLTSCTSTAASDIPQTAPILNQNLSQPQSTPSQEDSLSACIEEGAFLPLLSSLEESTMTREVITALENLWETDLSEVEVFADFSNTTTPYHSVTVMSQDRTVYHSATIDKDRQVIIGMDSLMQNGLVPVDQTNTDYYWEVAKSFVNDTLLVSQAKPEALYLPKFPKDSLPCSVIVTFPAQALYVEIASDSSIVGYRFMENTSALNAFISDYTLAVPMV